jgi:serine/threonine protein kinase
MPSSLTHPEDPELLAVAAGEEPSEALRAHLAACGRCREQVEQYKVEMELFRAGARQASLSPATVSTLAPDQGTSNGQTDGHSEAIAGSEPVDATADYANAPETDLGFACDRGESAEPPLPATIGKYLVVGRFPITGQAEVFRVIHPQFRQERVIKLAKEPVGADGRSEIIEEGRILADLDHPNLVRVYELDFHEDRPYLVMEYVRGRSLKDYASEHPLSPRQAAALLAKVCAAAEVAHRRGIVHRDIKPLNILIDEKNEPRLIDFGMARSRSFWSDEKARTGGTFAFMPPEQARIESPSEQDKVGPRSDVFALGAVLYFLLTGKPPFDGGNWQACWDRARRCDFDRKSLDSPKVPRELRRISPTRRASEGPHQVGAKVPRALRRICLKAMAADPAGRFASAEAMGRALRRFVAPLTAVGLTAGLAALVLVGGLVTWLVHRPEKPTRPQDPPEGKRPSDQTPPISVALPPMKGRIDLLVVKSKDGARRHVRLADWGSLPVRADDEVRVEARLDRPAYLYLFWLGSDGKFAPLYPWKDHDWSTRPAQERKVKAAELPEIVDDIMEIPHSPPGLETLVLLAREDSPLPRDEEAKLVQAQAGPPVPMPEGMNEAVWIEDGQEVAFQRSRAHNSASGEEPLGRGIPSPKTRKTEDPVLRIRAILSNKLQPLGSYSQAVLFPNVGG